MGDPPCTPCPSQPRQVPLAPVLVLVLVLALLVLVLESAVALPAWVPLGLVSWWAAAAGLRWVWRVVRQAVGRAAHMAGPASSQRGTRVLAGSRWPHARVLESSWTRSGARTA